MISFVSNYKMYLFRYTIFLTTLVFVKSLTLEPKRSCISTRQCFWGEICFRGFCNSGPDRCQQASDCNQYDRCVWNRCIPWWRSAITQS